MKVALVHDYIKDAGGAERVLLTLSEIFPKAPIYTAFYSKDSPAYKLFKGKKIIESPFGFFIKHLRLYSPLRFLLPWIWGSIDLSDYDLVVTSCSNYIARGFKVGDKTKVVAYCHTPPRFLYGFKTGFNWKKNWLIRFYGNILAHFLRIFDYLSAQKINYWIANSQNVKARIQKYYRKNSVVIYPPIETKKLEGAAEKNKKENYFLIVSRLVGAKGLEEAIKAANELNLPLKIVGDAQGFTSVSNALQKKANKNIEFLGRVDDEQLWDLYAKAKGFVALAKDEDFGMTVVEAQSAGTPVIAFNGGGFKETIINDKTGILIEDTDKKTIEKALIKFNKTKWNKNEIIKNAQKFSKENFIKNIKAYVDDLEIKL